MCNIIILLMWKVNTLKPMKKGCRFADDIFKSNFFNEKYCILIQITPKFVSWGTTDNNLALVQIMSCRRIWVGWGGIWMGWMGVGGMRVGVDGDELKFLVHGARVLRKRNEMDFVTIFTDFRNTTGRNITRSYYPNALIIASGVASCKSKYHMYATFVIAE